MITSTIEIAGLEGRRVGLTPQQLDDLAARIDGPLLRPGDEGWNDAVLVWNGMAARIPALVAQPTSAPSCGRSRARMATASSCAA